MNKINKKVKKKKTHITFLLYIECRLNYNRTMRKRHEKEHFPKQKFYKNDNKQNKKTKQKKIINIK
jgi:hypothetical protein